jgi:hypothetical protein
MYFVYMYETRIRKPAEIVLGRGGRREKDKGVTLIKIHPKHVCKCHSEKPLYS